MPDCGEFSYEFYDDDKIWITDYNGKTKELKIPTELDGITVTGIALDSFLYDDFVEEVYIPPAIELISDDAFVYCKNLKCYHVSEFNMHFCEVDGVLYTRNMEKLVRFPQNYQTDKKKMIKIPSEVRIIEDNAFRCCNCLNAINVPDHVEMIKSRAFYWSTIKEAILPESIDYIGEATFGNCTKLKSVIVKGNNLIHIGVDAFFGCRSITDIQIPDSCRAIWSNAFAGCTKLESIKLPSELEYIGMGAFANCKKLKAIEMPDKITKMGSQVFWMCTSLEDVKLPESIKIIPKHMFYECQSLKKVCIPDSVTDVLTNAFEHCDSLKQVIFPNSVMRIIEDDAFSSLKHVTIKCNPKSYAAIWAKKCGIATKPIVTSLDRFLSED